MLVNFGAVISLIVLYSRGGVAIKRSGACAWVFSNFLQYGSGLYIHFAPP